MDGSSYTGLASALIGGKRYLYVANFTKGSVDVYDNAFHRVQLNPDNQGEISSNNAGVNNNGNDQAFVDKQLPRDFVPFRPYIPNASTISEPMNL